MTEHTPTPWNASNQYLYGGLLESPLPIASGKKEWATDTGGPCHQEAVANAAFIVKAVNNHEALVKALEEIAEGKGRFSRDQFEHARNTIDDMKELARDALALVGEKP